VRVEVDELDAGSLQAAVERLPNLKVTVTKEVTAVLTKHAVNVEKLTTHTESGPMSSGMLFRADAELTTPSALDARNLKTDLEGISNDLMVELTLGLFKSRRC
jgi:glycine cleavage system regulatory protein